MAATIPTYNSSEIVRLMREPSTYPDRPRSIQMVETHISWVFLTDRYAYKLKKPVRFDFVDFSQPELRHRACQNELRLNRRLAGHVYISVLPIVMDHHGSLSLAGDGRPVDWVVKMRRLPADKSLSGLALSGQLTPEDENVVARHLANFYARLPPKRISPHDYRQQLRRQIRANREVLISRLPLSEQLRMRRALDSQLRFLAIYADLFDKRVMDGCIVEGHGDLRPEHIYLARPPAVIDCIEFSADLRTIDVADELSFLAMECMRIGQPGVGRRVLTTYEDVSRDQIPQTLLAFHQSYRASVRAKVVGLQVQQRIDRAQRFLPRLVHQYVDWAEHFALKLGRPLLLIVGGMMGTGKSTLARELAESLGAELLSTDHIRRSLVGASPTAVGYGEGNYQPDCRQRIYDDVFARAADILDLGRSAVLDGSFLTRALRQQATELADRHGAIPLCIECQCSRQTALSRIEARAGAGRALSEARVDLYDGQVNEREPLAASELAITLNTTHSLPVQLQRVCDDLRNRAEIGGML